MTTPESAAPAAAAPAAASPEAVTPEMAAQDAARRKMQGYFPRCPSREHFPVITGFVTPGSDFPPPHSLDASINMDVYDPTEIISAGRFERIRVVEVDDPFLIEVNWCVCGAFAASLCGCWEISFYVDDVDGVGKTEGQIGTTQTVPVDSVKPVKGKDDDFTRRCYTLPVTIPAGTVEVGAYSLLAIITLSSDCKHPKRTRLGDYLGFAEIPVLVFVKGE
jgi:hypothetical protein